MLNIIPKEEWYNKRQKFYDALCESLNLKRVYLPKGKEIKE